MEAINEQVIATGATVASQIRKTRIVDENRLRREQGFPEESLVQLPSDEELVRAATWDVLSNLGEKSAVMSAVAQFRAMIDPADKASGVFQADIISVVQEASSKRWIITFSDPRPKSKKPQEEIRTEPEWSEEGHAIGALARSLVGHRVVMYKHVDSFDDKKSGETRKSRVLRHMVDMGLTAKFQKNQQQQNQHPFQQQGYQNQGPTQAQNYQNQNPMPGQGYPGQPVQPPQVQPQGYQSQQPYQGQPTVPQQVYQNQGPANQAAYQYQDSPPQQAYQNGAEQPQGYQPQSGFQWA